MKTTSYEISKKLAEIGFEAETDFCWYIFNNVDGSPNICLAYVGEDIDCDAQTQSLTDERATRCYDLETILDAFPKGSENYTSVITEGDYIRVIEVKNSKIKDLETKRKNGESLASAAARLLIRLVEKGIINLKE